MHASPEFEVGTVQNRLRDADIAKILAAYRTRETADKYAQLATFEEIKDNDFNLNVPRYVNTFEIEADVDLSAVQTEIAEIEAQLASLERTMQAYLRELRLNG